MTMFFVTWDHFPLFFLYGDISVYTTVGRMLRLTDELLSEMNFELKSRGLTELVFRILPGGPERNYEELQLCCRCCHRHWNLAFPNTNLESYCCTTL